MKQWDAAHPRTPAVTGAETLSYGGGNGSVGSEQIGVQSGHSKVYLVFYGNQWGTEGTDGNGNATFSGDAAGAAPVTQMMFKGIGTGAELWSADLTQWCDGANVTSGALSCPSNANFVPYQSGGVLAGVWYDKTAASPAAATGTQLAQEALQAAAHFGNTTAASNRYAYYVILSPHGTNPDNYQGQYCAWHDWQGDGYGVTSTVGDVAFSNQPYNIDSGGGCGVGFVNNPGTLDGYTMTLGHEWHEMMSDQNPAGGWTNHTGSSFNGEENSDECAWIAAGSPGGAANVVMGTGTFTEQASWSNDTNECDISHAIINQTPGFTLSTTPAAASVCAGSPATLTVNVGSVASFNNAVALAATGNPTPSTVTLTPNPVPTLPGTSLLLVDNTTGAAAGVYPITINGTATGASAQSVAANLSVFAAVPAAPTLTSPANVATNQAVRPIFSWTGSNAESYTIDVATDAAFTNIVFTQSVTGTSVVPNVDLASQTQFYWRVTPANACGAGAGSAAFSFTTAALPGDCSIGTTAQAVYSYGFESGLSGWTLGAGSVGNTWADNTASFHGGANSWNAVDSATVSDQRFVSPSIPLPTAQLPLTLQFWHKRNIEANPPGCYDGAILEASTDAGSTWTQVSSASLLTDPYNGPVSASFGDPLGGLQAWCGVQDWTKVIVDIGSYAGQNAQFRFRLGSDSSTGFVGWYLDDVKVQSCSATTTQHTVTPSAGANGSIAPSTPVQVNDGSTTSFTLTPAVGYTSGPVTGSCGGTLVGDVFTTAPVTADCSVDAAFTQVAAGDVGISISDGRAYAQYGKALTYTVTVSNPTLTPISGVSVSDVFPAQLNISQANWTCLGGTGVTCTASGTGALSDSGVVIPAAGSVSYLVTAPVQPDAVGGDVVYTVTVTSAGDPNPANNTASDDDILVLFRSGFDPGNDGGNSPGH